MWQVLSAVWLALAPAPTADAGPPATKVIPFRIDAEPRVDGVFGDAAALRATIDRFITLEADMDALRDEFSTAVHETLTALAGDAPGGPATNAAKPANNAGKPPTNAGKPAMKVCPAATAAPYARALAAGTKYLLLGQQLQGRFREILRADELGDAVALTPDYRVKVKKARDLHQRLLDDYREMRVAFYDQLGAEMRHAECKTGPRVPKPVAADAPPPPNPSDATAWTLDDPSRGEARPPASAAEGAGPRGGPGVTGEAGPLSAPAIWIDVDNTLCAQATRVSVDGQPLGEVGPRKKTSVRTHAGPREICALPTSDARACGDPGTIRKAYLHEGWSLTVHCER